MRKTRKLTDEVELDAYVYGYKQRGNHWRLHVVIRASNHFMRKGHKAIYCNIGFGSWGFLWVQLDPHENTRAAKKAVKFASYNSSPSIWIVSKSFNSLGLMTPSGDHIATRTKRLDTRVVYHPKEGKLLFDITKAEIHAAIKETMVEKESAADEVVENKEVESDSEWSLKAGRTKLRELNQWIREASNHGYDLTYRFNDGDKNPEIGIDVSWKEKKSL